MSTKTRPRQRALAGSCGCLEGAVPPVYAYLRVSNPKEVNMTQAEFWKSLIRMTGTKSVEEAGMVLLTLAGIQRR